MWEFILPILGVFIGMVAAITGVGGGIFTVPLLTLIFSFSPNNAVGTSLTTILITAVAATLGYYYQKKINYKTGMILAVTTIPGAIAGARLTSVIPPRVLGLIFGGFLILVALRIMLRTQTRKKTSIVNQNEATGADNKNIWIEYKRKLYAGLVLGFSGGVVSGLLGVGGGIVFVPIMTLVFGFGIHFAVATSMFIIIATSVSGVTQHYLLGNINFEYALLLGIGTAVGAQVGAYTSKKISVINLQRIFSLMLLGASIQMILKFL